MNNDLSKKAKNDFEKDFFNLISNAIFGKTMESVRKRTACKTCSNRKKKALFSIRTKFSYYKVFHRKSICNRNEKQTEILMNKLIYSGLSVLDLSKI